MVAQQQQQRYCRCGTRLARDNVGALCSACRGTSRRAVAGAPVVPPGFWLTDRMQDAFAARHMGVIIYVFRTDAWHGTALSQEMVARWAGISQTQLSRIESGARVAGSVPVVALGAGSADPAAVVMV
jgi:hypothetical protein